MNTRKKLMIFVLILVFIPTAIFGVVSEIWGRRQLEEAQLSYLKTIMKAVRGEMRERRFGMQRVCSFFAEGSGLQAAIKEGDDAYLTERLQSLKRTYGYVDYAVIVDTHNRIRVKLSPNSIYEPSEGLAVLTQKALNDGRIIFSEESFPLEDLFVPSSQEYSKFLVESKNALPGEEGFLRHVLVSTAIVPIYDKKDNTKVLGALVICDVLNNDENFPHYVSANITGSILTLVVNDIRIATNTPRNGGEVIIGSKLGNGEILGKMNDTYWGNITLNGAKYKFLDEPIFNEENKKIGVIGVGVREDQFLNIAQEKNKVALWTALGCILTMLAVGRLWAKKITEPLLEVTAMTQEYCAKHFPGAFRKVQSEDECIILKETICELIRRLTLGEKERKQHVVNLEKAYASQRELADKLQKTNEDLELTVLDRTAHLQNVIDVLQESNMNKARFLANMSHELRTPLNVIIGSSQVLEEGTLGALTDKQKTYAQSIHSTGEYLLGLVNDLLDLSKLTVGKTQFTFRDIDVSELLEVLVAQIGKYKKEKEILISAVCVPQDMVIHGDVQKLQQILLNLLSNAVKFTPTGGQVIVKASLESKKVHFSVQDTGIGIAPEDKKRVFGEFEQVADPYTKTEKGTGLGLAIVKRLVELQGGEVWMESEVGQGTKVDFTLPVNLADYQQTQKLIGGQHHA